MALLQISRKIRSGPNKQTRKIGLEPDWRSECWRQADGRRDIAAGGHRRGGGRCSMSDEDSACAARRALTGLDEILSAKKRGAPSREPRHIGPDLQYIRINGTVVGALAGLLIAALRQLAR
jgi:hypothetical protein